MRVLLCALLGHAWDDWVRIPETMTIVSACRRCPEVRSARYEALVPDSFVEDVMRARLAGSPYGRVVPPPADRYRHE